MDAARVPPEEMDDQHVIDLFEFQWGYHDAFAGRHPEGPGRRVSEAMSRFMEFLRGLRDRLGAGDPVDLNDEMCAALETALSEIEKLLNDRETDAASLRALKGLKRTVNIALATRKVMLPILNDRSRLAETALAARFRVGARAIMLCIGAAGRAGLKLPDRAIFVDGDDPLMPEMVVIPAGRFIMGSPEDEAERSDDEGPQREVRVRRFALCRHAVTFAQYDAFCAATGAKPPDDEGWEREDRPVIHVSWDDAQAFVSWLNDQTPKAPYRLPSEAEWEYACRAGSTTPYEPNVAHKHGGQSIEPDEANFDGNFTYANASKGTYRKRTVPVMDGGFRPNSWGLWQMHGNVWEWCEDAYVDSYEGAASDAIARQPDEGNVPQSQRVLRGGSWYNYPRNLRSADRDRDGPDYRSRYGGFRLARTLTP
jgi:formylglycine-generating enzyme required for sulfatase activity